MKGGDVKWTLEGKSSAIKYQPKKTEKEKEREREGSLGGTEYVTANLPALLLPVLT
jgi:hypothetical protein